MLARRIQAWASTAPTAERMAAAAALVRAYLGLELTDEGRLEAERAMMLLVDDPSPAVRRALAEALAPHAGAPRRILTLLLKDAGEVAEPLLARSPALGEAELVELVTLLPARLQAVIASRRSLAAPVAAAIAEVADPAAVVVLARNPQARLTRGIVSRIIERLGHVAEVREALLARDDVTAGDRHRLAQRLADDLAHFAVARRWLSAERASRATREACDKLTVALGADRRVQAVEALVQDLRRRGQLTPHIALRALLCCELRLFEAILAELTGTPAARVGRLVADRNGRSLEALLARSGFAVATFPMFAAAVDAARERLQCDPPPLCGDRLDPWVIGRVIAALGAAPARDLDPLMLLMRHFEAEALRETVRDQAARRDEPQDDGVLLLEAGMAA